MVAAAVAAAVAFPVVHLVLRAVEVDDPAGELLTGRVAGFLVRTVVLGAVTTAGAVFVGVGVAWLLERTDVPGRSVLRVAAMLPLAVPTYVGALTVLAAFGPAGIVVELPAVVGFWGTAIVLTLATYPYVSLTSIAALRRMDAAVEEAGTTLGDSPWMVFHRVVLPQLRPAMSAGGLLVFLYALSDFGAVSVMRFDTLTRGIFLEYRSSFDRARAALLALVLVVLTVAAIAGERALRGRAAPARSVAGVRPPPPVKLGARARWTAAGGIAGLAVLGCGVPLGVLLHWALSGQAGLEPADVTARAAVVSLQLSGAAAAIAVAAALPVAVVAVRYRSTLSRLTESVAVAGYALPGLVVALALVFAATRGFPWLYETLSLVVFAYVVRFLPESLGAVRASLGQVDPALEEAARSLGRSRLGVTWSITLPLVRSGAIAGGALVFLTAMKELPATLLLRPAGVDTLATRVWTAAAQGTYGRAAPAALVLVLGSAVALWPLQLREVRER